jgi:glycosyltransferase involved in cell wall biosynthesis
MGKSEKRLAVELDLTSESGRELLACEIVETIIGSIRKLIPPPLHSLLFLPHFMGKRVDYCLVRHEGYPQDLRELKHATAIREDGYSIDVICLRGKGQPPVETMDGVNVFRLPLTHQRGGAVGYVLEYGLSFVIMSFVVLYRFLRYRYKVIHVSTMPDFLVFVALIPKLLGAKVMLDLHEPTPELWLTKFEGRKNLFYWLQVKLEKWAIRFADRCITVTVPLRQRFVERGADISKIDIVSNVCNTEIFSPRDQQTPTNPSSRFTLIMHGFIDRRVGHDTVVQAVAMLRDKIPGILFQIPGQGEFESELKQIVQDMGCNDLVSFLGYLSFPDLLKTLRSADVGIVAMERNPYSELIDTNKMYEYIAMRKPVIASRLLGVEANFDSSCVKLFEPGNASELAECILDLYNHPEQIATLVENAYARMLEKNSWQKTRQTLLDNVRLLAGYPGIEKRN